MSRPRTRPQERMVRMTVRYTPGTANTLHALALKLGRRSWRTLVSDLADGRLIATKYRDLSPFPAGEISDSLDLRESQNHALKLLCLELRAFLHGKSSVSVLLYAIAAGDVLLLPADPASAPPS